MDVSDLMRITATRVAGLLLLFLPIFAASAQVPLTVPSWAAPYPGVKVEERVATPALVDTYYETAAKPEAVLEHYSKLFEQASKPFQANFDGVGTTIRATAGMCDLLIRIHPGSDGSQVRVSCAASKFGKSVYGTPIIGVVEPPKPVETAVQEVKKPVEVKVSKEKRSPETAVDARGEPINKRVLAPAW